MKITGEEQSGWVTFERIDYPHLVQGFSDQTKVAEAHFLLLVVALCSPF